MENVTLALAVLLAAGMLTAKVGQLLKLPSVTGYILAGLLLGPSGFGIVTMESVGDKLHHFTQIALMLIAFGIGEQIEVKRLRQSARSIGVIGVAEAAGALIFVAFASFFAARLGGLQAGWSTDEYLALALLLGAVSVATAPATTLHVMRELKAKGPLTSTLMAVVAINNGLAIIFFGLAMSFAGQIAASGSGSVASAMLGSLLEISFSLSAGLLTGLALSFVLHHLKRQDEMLTAGLALLLLSGEGCRYFHLSPLLAGMAAGFTVINRVTRDVRLFRALNAFEPPIYVLFFTLAGSHLDLSSLGSAGWLGLVYFLCRIIGKYGGAYAGAFFTGASPAVRNYLGLALIPQAGVAIGLIFLISSDQDLVAFSAIITPVVLAGVVLSELSGPVCARLAVARAGESGEDRDQAPSGRVEKGGNNGIRGQEAFALTPWSWEKLIPHPIPEGVVAFGAKQSAKVKGLARMATILAHHYNALPMSVRVVPPSGMEYVLPGTAGALFYLERDEVEQLGYELQTELVPDEDVASGLVAAVEFNDARAVVLGYPIEGTFQSFQEILEKVAKNVACPVVLVRFYGELHTEKILVPVRSLEELGDVAPVVHALSRVGEHQLTILYLLSADESDERVEFKKRQLADWLKRLKITARITFQIEKTEARQETILKESGKHDLVVMGTSKKNMLKKLFFGSLVETVSRRIRKPLLIVYRPANEALLAGRKLQ
ncbi:MAG: hypothetical protein C4531_11785 [Desulfurivibrio sp.]|nr:MAG: hypothetical protein C4531_11785 [Desulfurivibrio sp.]